MDIRQTRLVEDMAGLFRGELACDPVSTSLYATDGSLHQVTPLAVACPRDRDDLITLVNYAAEQHLPLIARGAGTSVGGEALGNGIIVDFARHMHGIEQIGDQTVQVQPGVVHSVLNRVLAQTGRCFAPDPSNSSTTTIGSMAALDAAGSHSLRSGSTRDHVVGLEAVLANGTCFHAELEPLEFAPAAELTDPGLVTKREIVRQLARLLTKHATLIGEKQPADLPRNRAGYFLRGTLSPTHLNLPRLLVGSEGTLAIFSSITLRTVSLPAHRGAMLISFGSLEGAVRAVADITDDDPSACDLLDRRLLTLARETDTRFERLLPAGAEAALLVEHVGFSENEVAGKLTSLTKRLGELTDSGATAFVARTAEELEFLWSLPLRVVPLLNGVRAPTSSPLPFVEDVAVPPAALEEFVVRMRRILQRHEVTASLYSHAGVGQLHIRPFLPQPTMANASRMEALARDLYHAALSLGGSISGEHGLGLSRTAFLRSQYGELYRVFQEIKRLFDPHNQLNPGKVLTDDPHLTVHHLRPVSAPDAQLFDLQLRWSPQQMNETAVACHGCGACRTQEPAQRMCPFFHAIPSEDRSPRAKANAVRAVFDGRIAAHELASPEMRQLADRCFNCKQCERECPNHVDIPHLMIEAKAQYLATNGPRTSEWFLSRVHSWGDFLCRFSWLVNPLLGNSAARWVLERTLGVAAARRLPTFARRPFLKSARREWTSPPATIRGGQPVVYFVDHFANYHDPELATAFARILEFNSQKVHVPPRQLPSGMALISMGDLDTARSIAENNVRILAEFAREGSPIVCTEPAAAVCLKFEYPKLVSHPDAQVVAAQVVEAGTFLSGLRRHGQLRTEFAELPLIATYHTPCHMKMLGPTTPLADLCSLIPFFAARRSENGCSGLAGTFGLTREHFQESLEIGRDLIERMRADDHHLGLTECSSCRLQMEQRSPTPTLHPLKILALAYGLMPEIHRRLKPNTRKWLTS
ncbi:MAG: FAD-binding protein [Planctomycetes bacterium]|nr:FAD-binding protein [Planctomycetota bacterium]